MMKMAVKKETDAEPTKFPKEVLLKAAIFANRKDALGVVVKDGESLTIEEAQARLDEFMKGKVN
jgi:hypothetical protein